LWAKHDAKVRGQNPDTVVDFVFYLLFSGMIGARLHYVLVSDWESFSANPLFFFQIWKGGLSFYGGVITAFAASFLFFKRKKVSASAYLDIIAPGIALGHVFGRIGCFLAGCCYGRELDHAAWYGVVFPDTASTIAPPNVPLYPTQLMESGAELLLFVFLLLLRKRQKFSGQIFASYIAVYSLVRFVLEYFRGDLIRGFVFGGMFSTSQFLSLLLFFVSLFYILFHLKREKKR